MATVLVTGGAGYVGSHTIVHLLNNHFQVIALDNLINCFAEHNEKPESLKRVEKLTNKTVLFYNVDIKNKNALCKIFQQVRNIPHFLSYFKLIRLSFLQHKIDCVMHFAALKAVGESCQIPLTYYQNNITGSNTLFEVILSCLALFILT